MYQQIHYIVDNIIEEMAWNALEPKVFYRNDQPYGLIAVTATGFVASTTTDPSLPFTREMLRYLIQLNRQQEITLITDHIPSQEHIRSFLEPKGFECWTDNHILYSRRKQWA